MFSFILVVCKKISFHANQLVKAIESIEKGRSLAQELSLPEVVETFSELNKRLQAEK
ncbi:hypothetical protein [Bacillus benzoevorans]|uniref:Uncharacterized protein n=1 Tax=Bacillus benzoevorans TaxID=1456 RepID=A0A7X0HR20_9BACI|nr:hypothetical protein [Bacillus benzoevorans]